VSAPPDDPRLVLLVFQSPAYMAQVEAMSIEERVDEWAVNPDDECGDMISCGYAAQMVVAKVEYPLGDYRGAIVQHWESRPWVRSLYRTLDELEAAWARCEKRARVRRLWWPFVRVFIPRAMAKYAAKH
jgi:hypothetical protein